MASVFLDRRSLDLGDLDLSALEAAAPGLSSFDATAPEQVAERLADAEVAIVNKVVLDRHTLSSCPRLRLICVVATGTNNVDLEAARQAGITVVNCRGYGTDSLAQHVMLMMLAMSRSLLSYQASVAAGEWQRASQFCLLDHPIEELGEKTLGVVGYGTIGQAVARLAEAFGMTVRVAQRPGSDSPAPDREPLAELLPEVDVLTLHCPLTADTRNLIGAAELDRMGRHALLVNAARGGIVDEQALADALRQRRIGGAAVDVLSEEPPVSGSPLLEPGIPNLLVTPHCAWGSRTARQRIVTQTAENIDAWRRGGALRVVAAPRR